MADKIFEQHRQITVLILEDLPDDAGLMERELEKAGLTITTVICDDRGSYTSELRRHQPDLILADYSLPNFSGLEALIIAQEECPDVPFVFVTGTIGEEIAAETILSGANGLVLKSNLKKLPEIVLKAFEEKGRWFNHRAKYASTRINQRIKANVVALERLNNFLETKTFPDKNSQQQMMNAIQDLQLFSDELKNIDSN